MYLFSCTEPNGIYYIHFLIHCIKFLTSKKQTKYMKKYKNSCEFFQSSYLSCHINQCATSFQMKCVLERSFLQHVIQNSFTNELQVNNLEKNLHFQIHAQTRMQHRAGCNSRSLPAPPSGPLPWRRTTSRRTVLPLRRAESGPEPLRGSWLLSATGLAATRRPRSIGEQLRLGAAAAEQAPDGLGHERWYGLYDVQPNHLDVGGLQCGQVQVSIWCS